MAEQEFRALHVAQSFLTEKNADKNVCATLFYYKAIGHNTGSQHDQIVGQDQ